MFKRVSYVSINFNRFCNMGCSYCYLGGLTENTDNVSNSLELLHSVINSYTEAHILIDKFIFHGAEPTVIPKTMFESILKEMRLYFKKYETELKILGHRKPEIALKTNMLNLDKYIDLFKKYNVKIGGSFDLPFSSHEKNRVLKNGKSTLDKILNNIKLLASYPYEHNISSTVTIDALNNFEEFVQNIEYLQNTLGYDVKNNYYIMFTYDSAANKDKFESTSFCSMSQENMVEFYNKLKNYYKDTEFEKAILYSWFREMVPTQCFFEKNCVDKHAIIQNNGDIYTCHRAQPIEALKLGNIHEESLVDIKDYGTALYENLDNQITMDDDCAQCNYFKYCYLNCPIVRIETKRNKSFTCLIQKEIYADNPTRFPPCSDEERFYLVNNFCKTNNIQKFTPTFVGDKELDKPDNHIETILKKDKVLDKYFNYPMVLIEYEDKKYKLARRTDNMTQGAFTFKNELIIYVNKEMFKLGIEERDIEYNRLKIVVYGNSRVRYGLDFTDKRIHRYTIELFYSELLSIGEEDAQGFIRLDISKYIDFKDDEEMLITFFTPPLQERHEKFKQQNPYYHIQFYNMPWYYIRLKK